MDNSNLDIELIENYLFDKSSEEEKEIVENRLSNDTEFSILFEELSLIIKGTKYAARKDILTQLKEKESEIKFSLKNNPPTNTTQNNTRQLWAPIGVAASILLLIGLVWFNNPFKKPAPDPLAEFYEPLPAELLYNFVRSEPVDTLPKKAKAAKALKKQSFDEAILILEDIIYNENDFSENVIRTYSNALLQNNLKNCEKDIRKIQRLYEKQFESSISGLIAIDYVLLQKKCNPSSNLEILHQEIEQKSLLDWDKERWEKMKEHL